MHTASFRILFLLLDLNSVVPDGDIEIAFVPSKLPMYLYGGPHVPSRTQ